MADSIPQIVWIMDNDRIFGQFERVICHSNISGLGQGLYITREIVHKHHGE